MKILAHFVAAPLGAYCWHELKTALAIVFDSKELFGHLLQSSVNLFSFAVVFVVFEMMLLRYVRLVSESRWERHELLPVGRPIRSWEGVEPFAKRESSKGPARKLRPLCMLRGTFDAVEAKFSSESAHQALRTQYEMMRNELDARYSIPKYLVGAVISIGFLGTLLGLSASMASLQDTEATVASLQIAFDTSLVSTSLTLFSSLLLTALIKYDRLILLSAYHTILQEFVFKIRDAEGTKQ